MNIELEEKISEILREPDRTAFVVNYEKVKKLYTLIQEERKEAYNEGYEEGKLLDTKVYVGMETMKKIQEEAVRGFAKWLNVYDFLFRDGLMMKMYEHYLSHQREKGTK